MTGNEIKYASIWRRFLACFIDYILFGLIPFYAVLIPISIAMDKYPKPNLLSTIDKWQSFVFLLFFWLFPSIILLGNNGSSIGGIIMKIRVISKSEKPLKPLQVYCRFFIISFFTMISLFYSPFYWILFIGFAGVYFMKTEKYSHQTMWDGVTNCIVVDRKTNSSEPVISV